MDPNRFIVYPAVFSKESSSESTYFVEFPDLAGCFTQGRNIEEAFCYAQDALAVYFNEMNRSLPKPSQLHAVQNKYPDAVVLLVSVDVTNYKLRPSISVKKTLTIPEWLNTLSEKYHLNFSQILKNALIEQLTTLNTLSDMDQKKLCAYINPLSE